MEDQENKQLLNFYLRIFQGFGLYPIPIEGGKTRKCKQFELSCLWNLIIVITEFVLVFVFHQYLFYGQSSIGTLNDVLLFVSTSLCHMISIGESFFQRNCLKEMWSHFSEIQKLVKKDVTDYPEIRNLFWKFTIFLICTIIVELTVITNISEDDQWQSYWCINIFSLMVTRLKHLQHILFIDLMYFSVRDHNRRLESCIEWSKIVGQDKIISKDFLYRGLKVRKNHFRKLIDILICINTLFAWSQLTNMAQNFIEITAELYWIYNSTQEDTNFLWRKFSWLKGGRASGKLKNLLK